MMMMKQKSSLADRLNIGIERRELKLGSTFSKNPNRALHTIKYDFKPASVDKNKMANVQFESNKQVTVTVPNLENSGVPNTVYKGNHRNYTKECIIIIDKKTGDMTLEKLSYNIQVKKTRSEANKPAINPVMTTGPPKLENTTMRLQSKTKVSTGSRRNNIIDFKPRNSPMQGSPSAGVNSSVHKSPQSAPAWNANNAQATLPSIPIIDTDVEMPNSSSASNLLGNIINTSPSAINNHNNSVQDNQYQFGQTKKQKKSLQNNANRNINNQRHQHQQQHQQPHQQQHQQQQHQQYHQPHQQQQQQQHQYQQQQLLQQQTQQDQQQTWLQQTKQQKLRPNLQEQQNFFQNQQQLHQDTSQVSNGNAYKNHIGINGGNHFSNNSPRELGVPESLVSAPALMQEEIGEISSSESSNSSDSDSGSESDSNSSSGDSDDEPEQQQKQKHQHQQKQQQQQQLQPQLMHQQQYHQQQQHQQQQHHQQQQQNFAKSDWPNNFLERDLQLSSNSSDDDE